MKNWKKWLVAGCMAALLGIGTMGTTAMAMGGGGVDRSEAVAEEEKVPSGKATQNSRVSSKAWKKINGVCYNGSGQKLEGAVTRGIDVSEWQDTINWSQVKKSNVDFAFVRISYGLNHLDKTYDYNMKQAEKAGIPTGTYVYSLALNTQQALKEAQLAIRKMDLHIDNYLLFNWGMMPDNKYDVNNRGPLSTDMIGMNYEYPDGNYATRERIWQEHVDYTKGLLYFLTHDERVPSKLRDQVSRFGWAKDEFVDNDNFPTQLYVREARRLNGEYIMTQKNCQGEETVGDAIGMAAYGMDSHNCQRIVTNGMVKNEGDVQYHGFPPYPISYKSITPKREECTNLLVPVCISSTHIAFGSIRMEPVFMVLGQSAAVASALAINDNTDVQTIDVTKLRKILKDNPYLDGSTPEILVDDSDIDKIERSGHWQKSFGAHYKNSYLKSANQKNNCSFTFMPVIKKADTYEVFFYCTALPDQEMPEVMAFDITGKEGTKQVEISPRSHKGSWVSLGTYAFEKGNWTSSIKIDGCRSKGALFADAIILVPKK